MNDLTEKLLNGYWTGLTHAAVVTAALALPWGRLDDEPYPITGIGLLYRVMDYADHAGDVGDVEFGAALLLALVITGSVVAFLNAKLRRRPGLVSATVGAAGTLLFPILAGDMLEYPHVGWGVVLLTLGVVPGSACWRQRAYAVGLARGLAGRPARWSRALRNFPRRPT